MPDLNAEVRRILDKAVSVTITDGSPYATEAPRITLTPADIRGLAAVLTLTGRMDRPCLCLGSPTIDVTNFLGEPIAQWTLHELTLRGVGQADAELADPDGLTRWLADRGLPGRLADAERFAELAQAEAARRARWIATPPKTLMFVAEMLIREEPTASVRLSRELLRWYPEPGPRIRMLLSWAGFPAREPAPAPSYELVPLQTLLAEPLAELEAALTSIPLVDLSVGDGAFELLLCPSWTEESPVLLDLVTSHVTQTGTPDMRRRLRHFRS